MLAPPWRGPFREPAAAMEEWRPVWEEEITRQVKALLLPPPCSAWATIMGVRAARLMDWRSSFSRVITSAWPS